jgi:hypothetical protein
MSIAYGGDKITFSDGSTVGNGWTGFKNRIINGAMTIDQRNAGASATFASTGAYCLDRFRVSNGTSTCTVQQSSDAPTGFKNSLLWTVSTTDNSVDASHALQAKIEGYNIADLGFGTASPSNLTLSFWVKSSLVGTYGVGFSNDASDRSYVATYTINSANTWEQKTITITADNTGTWLSTNGMGLEIAFDLGSGSNYNATAGSFQSGYYRRTSGCVNLANTSSATWRITGVQLEKGSTATSFDYRPYSAELAMCQRYFYMVADGASKSLGLGTMYSPIFLQGAIFFPVTMRATPSLSATSGTNYYEFIRNEASDGFNSLTIGTRASTTIGEITNGTEISGTVGHSGFIRTDNAATKVGFSAEL